MGFLKSYLTPGKEKAEDEKTKVGETKMNDLTPAGKASPPVSPGPLPVSVSGLATPKSPIASRPGSLYSNRNSMYPQGDFRNQPESLIDVKADVMCSWLYQQQLERQYATGMLPGEGVVLKKSRHNYACYPPQLRDMQFGLYESAMELNVRVCQAPNLPPFGTMY